MTEMYITLQTECEFDAAHRLVGYEGNCRSIHGHTWKVVVCVRGFRSQRDSVGILLDFKDVKNLVRRFDHNIILWNCIENEDLMYVLDSLKMRVFLMSCNPTAENFAMYFWKELKKMREDLEFNVEVWESKVSYASVGFKNV